MFWIFTFLLNTLLLGNWLTVGNLNRKTFLYRPCVTLVLGDVQTLSFLDCLTRLEVDLPDQGRAVSDGNLQTVLLWLCRSTELTGGWTTHISLHWAAVLPSDTPTLFLGHNFRDSQTFLRGNWLTLRALLRLGEERGISFIIPWLLGAS